MRKLLWILRLVGMAYLLNPAPDFVPDNLPLAGMADDYAAVIIPEIIACGLREMRKGK